MIAAVCWLNPLIGKASADCLIQNDLASFKRPQMICIDHPEFMSKSFPGRDYFYRKVKASRVNIVKAIEFVFYAATDPQINRTIYLVERKPSHFRRHLLLRFVILPKSFLSFRNYVSHHDTEAGPCRSHLIGEDNFFVNAAARTRPKFCADCASTITEQIAYNQFGAHTDAFRRRVTNISIYEVYHCRNVAARNGHTYNFSLNQLNPRSVASNKSVLSDNGLSLSRCGLPMCFSYGVSCSAESLKQDIKAGGGYANRKDGDGDRRNANESLPRPILPLLGAMMMIGGLILCWWSIAQRRVCALLLGWAAGCLGTMLFAIGVGNYVTPLY